MSEEHRVDVPKLTTEWLSHLRLYLEGMSMTRVTQIKVDDALLNGFSYVDSHGCLRSVQIWQSAFHYFINKQISPDTTTWARIFNYYHISKLEEPNIILTNDDISQAMSTSKQPAAPVGRSQRRLI